MHSVPMSHAARHIIRIRPLSQGALHSIPSSYACFYDFTITPFLLLTLPASLKYPVIPFIWFDAFAQPLVLIAPLPNAYHSLC